MADGTLIINPAQAISSAQEMVSVANALDDLLREVSMKMDEVNSTDTNMYQGGKNPQELRAELDEFKRFFDNVREQIVKSSNDIITIANTAQAE